MKPNEQQILLEKRRVYRKEAPAMLKMAAGEDYVGELKKLMLPPADKPADKKPE